MNKETREECLELSSGIPLYSFNNPGVNRFYLSLFLRAGSMFEEERESGITHFLEHILIRNVNEIMGGELYRILDRNGLDLNASTYSEMVQFYVTGAKEKLLLGAELLSKLLSPIILPPSEIDLERKRIKAEMRESDERGSLASFTSGILHEGTSLSRSITGSFGSVGGFTRRKLESYRKRVFTRENVFLYLTGSFDEEGLSGIERIFAGYPLPNGEKNLNLAPVSRNFGKREPKLYVKAADYTVLRFSFDLDMTRISLPESDLLYDTLLGGYSSRLFIELSEKRGLFYDIQGASECYPNIGSLSFYFELKGADAAEAVRAVLELLSEFKNTTLKEEECMKASYVDNAMMLCDDSRDLNFTLAYDNHIMGLGYATIGERIEAYRRVTPERLREVASIVFRPENLTLTAKGNRRALDYAAIESALKSFG